MNRKLLIAETEQGELPCFDTEDGLPKSEAEHVFERFIRELDKRGWLEPTRCQMSFDAGSDTYTMLVHGNKPQYGFVVEVPFSAIRLIDRGVDGIVEDALRKVTNSYREFEAYATV